MSAFAALTAAEVMLALPLLTGASREGAAEVPAATEIVVQQTSERRHRIDSVLADKARGRDRWSPTRRPSGPGSGKRGTPVAAAGVEDSAEAGDYTEVQPPDDSGSGRNGDAAPNEESAPSDASSTPRDAHRSSIRRGIPLAPAPQAQSPSAQPQRPSPQPQNPPPPPPVSPPPPPPALEPPPPPSTTIVTRTTIRTSPPPPPSTTTTVASSSSTTTTSQDGEGCKGRRCDKDEEEDDD